MQNIQLVVIYKFKVAVNFYAERSIIYKNLCAWNFKKQKQHFLLFWYLWLVGWLVYWFTFRVI